MSLALDIQDAVGHAWKLAEVEEARIIGKECEGARLTTAIAVWRPERPKETEVVCYDPVPMRM